MEFFYLFFRDQNQSNPMNFIFQDAPEIKFMGSGSPGPHEFLLKMKGFAIINKMQDPLVDPMQI